MIVVLFLILALLGVSGPVFSILAALAIARQTWRSAKNFVFFAGGGIA